jgi:hypothetical protein
MAGRQLYSPRIFAIAFTNGRICDARSRATIVADDFFE